MSEARDRLLSASVDYIRTAGVASFSLRQCAAAIGSSHRMLSYHFGSREGLLAAVGEQVAAEQRELLAGGAAIDRASMAAMIRSLWSRLAAPAGQAEERLFLELHAMALQQRSESVRVPDRLVEDWAGPLTELGTRAGLSKADARAEARLGLAVLRGLLLDLLASGNRRAANAALERYLARLPG